MFVTDSDTVLLKDPYQYLLPERVCDFQHQGDHRVCHLLIDFFQKIDLYGFHLIIIFIVFSRT